MGAFLAFATAIAAVSAPLPASVAPDQVESEIVVTGRKALDPKTLRAVVRSLGKRSDTGDGDYQMARWIDPVCPVVLGLPPSDARSLENDVKAVASLVGAPSADGACQRNIEIIITSDPRSALLNEQSRQPWFFRGIPKTDVTTLIYGSAPVRWGSVTNTYSADGTPMRLDGSVYDADGSRLHAATQTGLGRMIIIVDRDKVYDLTTESLHDYISLIALAQIKMDFIHAASSTILSIADGKHGKSGGLQPFDVAYLKALYSVSPSLHGDVQQAAMSHKVASLLSH